MTKWKKVDEVTRKRHMKMIKEGKFKIAPMERIGRLQQSVVEEFMKAVFGFEPGEYIITDESTLDMMGTARAAKKIEKLYGAKVEKTWPLWLVITQVQITVLGEMIRRWDHDAKGHIE